MWDKISNISCTAWQFNRSLVCSSEFTCNVSAEGSIALIADEIVFITGWPRLEGTSKDSLVQSFLERRAWMRLSSTLSSYIVKNSGDGHFTATLGRLLQ